MDISKTINDAILIMYIKQFKIQKIQILSQKHQLNNFTISGFKQMDLAMRILLSDGQLRSSIRYIISRDQ